MKILKKFAALSEIKKIEAMVNNDKKYLIDF